MKNKTTFLEKLIGFAIALVPLPLLRGYAVALMWRWFVVPSLRVPAIGVMHAVGMMLMIEVVAQRKAEDEFDDEWRRKLLVACMMPLLAIGLAWIVRQFV